MNDAAGLAARKQLLLARSTLYRLRLQLAATEIRESIVTPTRGLALVKYLPIAIVAFRLFSRRRGASLAPSLVDFAGVIASWVLSRRGGA